MLRLTSLTAVVNRLTLGTMPQLAFSQTTLGAHPLHHLPIDDASTNMNPVWNATPESIRKRRNDGSRPVPDVVRNTEAQHFLEYRLAPVRYLGTSTANVDALEGEGAG